MTFVHVKDFRLDSESGERFHSADAENDLLPDPHFEITAVKFGRDEPVFRLVLRDIGVEQVEADTPHAQFPNLRPHLAIEEANGYEEIAFAAPHFPDRQMMEVLIQADGMLNAILVDLLLEVAVPVEQSDGDEVQIEIARGLAMIPGQDTEAS